MPLIAQKLAGLLDGVSQKPAAVRPSSQAEIQENCLSHRVHGLRRRPPTSHIAKLGDIVTGGGGGSTLPGGTLAAFYRGGMGFKKGAWPSIWNTNLDANDWASIIAGVEGLPDAVDGELASAWLDQTGNKRHILLGLGTDYGGFDEIYNTGTSPLIAGPELYFGRDGTADSGYVIPSTEVRTWQTTIQTRTIIAAIRADNAAPVANGYNSPWSFNRSGGASDGSAKYPDTTGHIYEPAFGPNRSLLVPAGVDLSTTTVIAIRVGDYSLENPNDFVFVNGVQQYGSHDGYSMTNNGGWYIGVGGGNEGGFWRGHFKHLAIFDGEVTDTDIAAWATWMQNN